MAKVTFTDGVGRNIATKDAIGNYINSIGYDASSNPIKSRDANGLGEDCTFDKPNRKTNCADLQKQAETTDRSYTYNAHNAVLTATDKGRYDVQTVFVAF